jgi:hypothetical protein
MENPPLDHYTEGTVQLQFGSSCVANRTFTARTQSSAHDFVWSFKHEPMF